MCHAHYRRFRLGKPVDVVITRAVPRGGQCQLSDCDKDAWTGGLCSTHYNRRREGEADWDRPIDDYFRTDDLGERLRHYCPEGAPDECWEWTKAKNKGYGMISIEKSKLRGAHIVAWEVANGKPLPDGEIIRHTCDNPPCTNPAHLVVGTHADNARDMVDRGRVPQRPRGFKHKTPEDIAEMKSLHASGLNFTQIAERFECTRQTVAKVVRGQSYANSGCRVSSVAKLSDESVRQIRELYATSDYSQQELARKFGSEQATVSRIVLGKAYGHVV